jgi:hypothetical protein
MTTSKVLVSTSLQMTLKVGTYCNITAYRNTVLWHVSKVGYVVMLRACSVRHRYLAVASKGWYGYGMRSGRATWHVTTFRPSHLLYNHDASGSHNKLGTPWCNARRIPLHHEAQYISSDHNSVLYQSLATYSVIVRDNITSVYPPLKWGGMLMIHLHTKWHTASSSG